MTTPQKPASEIAERALNEAIGSERALVSLLTAEMRRFASLLPRHLTPERVARLALEAGRKNPDILKCTSDSIIKALIDCSIMGLEPVGKGGVHLVPWQNKGVYELTAITDYRGEITLAYRSGIVKDVIAESVHEGELFRYVAGDDPKIIHEPDLTLDRHNGSTLQLVYAVVRLKTGGAVRKVLNRKGVDRYKSKSKARNGPWREDGGDYVAMALKTVIRRAMNEVPQSAEYREIIRSEAENEFGAEPPIVIDLDPAEASVDAIMKEARGE